MVCILNCCYVQIEECFALDRNRDFSDRNRVLLVSLCFRREFSIITRLPKKVDGHSLSIESSDPGIWPCYNRNFGNRSV